MALYRYVAAQDDLLELMVDTALGTTPPPRPGETWREGPFRSAIGARDACRADPWTMRVRLSAPPLGPNNVRRLEYALAGTRDTGLTPDQLVSCVLLFAGFARSEELLVADPMAGQHAGQPADHYARALSALIDERDFPQLAELLSAGEMPDEEDIDHEFRFGIERILDGIAVLGAPGGGPRRPARRDPRRATP